MFPRPTPTRRRLLRGFLSAAAVAALTAAASRAFAAGRAEWPRAVQWERLKQEVDGRLIRVKPAIAACLEAPEGPACARRLKAMRNPFFVEEQAGATILTGWHRAWTSAPSAYAVAVERPEDVAAAVRFAAKRGVKLVVKGTGHDYLGRSSAPNSLLVWTRPYRAIAIDRDFRPEGSPQSTPAVTAMRVQAGANWAEAFEMATRHSLFVQGGHCTTVGAAGGFIQGGGFGPFTKMFGTGASNVLEYEVVLANGDIVVANDHQYQDLFWALRGGGGGTFGVVTRTVLRAHPMPSHYGLMFARIQARSDADYKRLLAHLVAIYREHFASRHWSIQFELGPSNALGIWGFSVGLNEDEARGAWDSLLARSRGKDDGAFQTVATWHFNPFPTMWSAAWWKAKDPSFVFIDDNPRNPSPMDYASAASQASAYVTAHHSRYIPARSFDESAQQPLVEALYEASRHHAFHFQTFKGLAEASEAVRARARETSMHPAVLDATALLIISDLQRARFPGLPGHEPDRVAAESAEAGARAATEPLWRLLPAATYPNEADYHETGWQELGWGSNYSRLLDIKRKYDPSNLFSVHHGVGSEF